MSAAQHWVGDSLNSWGTGTSDAAPACIPPRRGPRRRGFSVSERRKPIFSDRHRIGPRVAQTPLVLLELSGELSKPRYSGMSAEARINAEDIHQLLLKG